MFTLLIGGKSTAMLLWATSSCAGRMVEPSSSSASGRVPSLRGRTTTGPCPSAQSIRALAASCSWSRAIRSCSATVSTIRVCAAIDRRMRHADAEHPCLTQIGVSRAGEIRLQPLVASHAAEPRSVAHPAPTGEQRGHLLRAGRRHNPFRAATWQWHRDYNAGMVRRSRCRMRNTQS